MNRPWNKDIHDRLKDFPKKAPEGLLDDIKKEMARRGLTPAPVARRRPVALLRIASVAAVMLLLLGIGHLFTPQESGLIPAGTEIAVPPGVEGGNLPVSSASVEDERVVPPAPRRVAKAAPDVITLADTLAVMEDSIVGRNVAEKGADEAKEAPAGHRQETVSAPEVVRRRTLWTYEPRKRKKASYAVGIHCSGLVAQADVSSRRGGLVSSIPSLDSSDMGMTSSESHSTHHLPVKLGLSFRYSLGGRWIIQSGLNYNYLASDLSYNSPSVSYDAKQKLHYLGIPLQVGLRIWESKRFRGYVSAGGQVDKLVSGKADVHCRMAGYTTDRVENISDGKLLFSALASIGAEYMLGRDFSLYAEPGIHYYFKNGNGLRTRYNDQPLNLNITIGFRFHWEK